ncbi:MAG TPA: hypothetical protein PK765_05065 [bacterium]|nr:hypothetical protein [bacterium]
MRKFFLPFAVFCLALPVISAQADDSGGRFRYPFDQIADPSCRFSAWNTLDDDCKIDLPRIEGADYAKYKNNFLYERVYTVLWEGTYDYGWDV